MVSYVSFPLDFLYVLQLETYGDGHNTKWREISDSIFSRSPISIISCVTYFGTEEILYICIKIYAMDTVEHTILHVVFEKQEKLQINK
jgi:hypothetical protein